MNRKYELAVKVLYVLFATYVWGVVSTCLGYSFDVAWTPYNWSLYPILGFEGIYIAGNVTQKLIQKDSVPPSDR